MGENNININPKNRILLSRNTPVALVVGASGFLGSYLTEALLKKGIQVVGLDNFSTSNKKNLEEAVKSSKFHFVDADVSNLNISLDRLDYVFVLAEGFSIEGIFPLLLEKKPRCILISWIDLYDKNSGEKFHWFKEAEKKLAGFCGTYNINARILRLGPVFGPRMRFDTEDPIVRLIQAALHGEIQKESALEFSSRALYVWDAVDLMIKSILSGATAQKIFDGVLPTPIKVSDIKQVLLDPVWYEARGFTPTELPPWPTPNLAKTMKFLNWRPKTKLVEGLRQTLSYFRDNEIIVPESKERGTPKKWENEKKETLEKFKEHSKNEVKSPLPKFRIRLPNIYLLFATAIIVFGIIYPLLALGWGIVTFRYELKKASDNLTKGDFDKSLISLARAKAGIDEAQTIISSLEVVRKTNLLNTQFNQADYILNLAQSSILSIQSATRGIESLYLGLKAATGEIQNQPFDFFTTAQVELGFADNNLSKVAANIKDGKKINVPKFLDSQILKLGDYVEDFSSVVKKAQVASVLLPKIISSNKNYLILLQNNMELRPSGGFVGSYGLISFEGGKLKKIEVNDIYAADEKLSIHVEPPKEIKEDLGQKDFFLRDSNWEPDFPTSAKQAKWFFNKETGIAPLGVIAFDLTAMENLLEVLGPLELLDYNEKITSQNLFEEAIKYEESFLTALATQIFNKIFFLPNQNWPKIAAALGKSLESRHISIFLDDPKLFSYLVSEGWSGVLPRPKDQKVGEFEDFLALVEANLGSNRANYYLDRNYQLETVVGKEGEIKHRLRINYTNRSPSESSPSGKYKNRMRFYLPHGAKLIRALWSEVNITPKVSAFVDYGRSGYSVLLELSPKEQKTLVLDWELPKKLEFKDGKAVYRLDIVKQAGTLKDPLSWKITYPISYHLVSGNGQKRGFSEKIGPQQHSITTDLSKDRRFEVLFTK